MELLIIVGALVVNVFLISLAWRFVQAIERIASVMSRWER